jgi:hypothetical protein
MDETIKEQVRDRASGQCEYCHLPEAHVLTPFQVEHVVAKQHRGGIHSAISPMPVFAVTYIKGQTSLVSIPEQSD